MKRLLVLLFVLLLSGCASYGSYRHVDRHGAGDYYYDLGHAGYTYYGYPYDVAYRYYPYYYSLFWGFRPYYYDPFFAPGFHYGVTWFPRTWFSFSLGGFHDWGYYHAYSPWRHSFWDNYYTWYQTPRRVRHGRVGQAHTGHFGSARNEAERVANLNRQTRGGLQTTSRVEGSRTPTLGARGPVTATPAFRTRAAQSPRAQQSGVATERFPAERGSTIRPGPRTGSAARPPQGQIRGARPAPRSDDPHPQANLQRGSWRAEPRYGSSAASAPPAPFQRPGRVRAEIPAARFRQPTVPVQRSLNVQPSSPSPRFSDEGQLQPLPARTQRAEGGVPRSPVGAPRGQFSTPAHGTGVPSSVPAAAPRSTAPPPEGTRSFPIAPRAPEPASGRSRGGEVSGRVRGQR